jgi:hypothetical protein
MNAQLWQVPPQCARHSLGRLIGAWLALDSVAGSSKAPSYKCRCLAVQDAGGSASPVACWSTALPGGFLESCCGPARRCAGSPECRLASFLAAGAPEHAWHGEVGDGLRFWAPAYAHCACANLATVGVCGLSALQRSLADVGIMHSMPGMLDVARCLTAQYRSITQQESNMRACRSCGATHTLSEQRLAFCCDSARIAC